MEIREIYKFLSKTSSLTGKALIQSSHVEVKALVDNGTRLGILWVDGVVSGLLSKVDHDRAGLPQGESVVDQSWNGVLRVELQ